MHAPAEEGKRRRVESSDTNQDDTMGWLWQPGSHMSDLMQHYDWAASVLGPLSTWYPQWQTAVSLMLSSRFPIALWLGENLCLAYNDAYVPILGTKHPAALGKSAKEIWADLWPEIGAMHTSVWTAGKAFYSEDHEMFSDRNGYLEEVHFSYSLSPMRSATGKIIGSFNVAQETTNRFIAERRLDSLRAVTAQAVRATSPDEVMRECLSVLAPNSRDFPFVLAYTPGDGDKQKLVAQLRVSSGAPVLADDFNGSLADHIREVPLPPSLVVANEMPVSCNSAIILPISASTGSELSPATAENTVFGVLIIGVNPYKKVDDALYSYLKLLSSSVCGALSTAREYVRERKKAEQLAELDKLKTKFFHNVSHELRTPLTLMIGPLDDVLRSTLDRSQRDSLECTLRNAKRLLRLVNLLLDFARLEAGRERATYRPTDLASLVADLASNFRSACAKAGIDLVVECSSLKEHVYIDCDLMEKVVLNLMGNAFKFTTRGSLKVSLKYTNQGALLAVSDTGCGIPQSELSRIFDRFHTVGRAQEGTGIGLALVAEIVRLHGGTVDVVSEVGVGTTFTVSIPFGRAHLPPEQVVTEPLEEREHNRTSPVDWWLDGTPTGSPRHSSSPAVPHATAKLRATFGAKVLIVDDNSDMRGYLARILTEHGYVVFVAQDGMEALQRLQERPDEALVDLVLSDVMMPRLDGPGLLQAIRSSASPLKDIPVVFLSARAGEDAVMGGVVLGADDYLVKPFSVSELVTRVGARIELTRFRLGAARREQVLREQAEKASAAKDHFIAVLSHELRTPLTPALMIAEAGENDTSLPEAARKDMATIASNIRLEVHLIADLLDITKIRQGKLELHLQTRVDTHALLHQCMALLKESIKQRAHRIELSLACEPCFVTGDATRLQQVFWNIIGNAIKFTPQNGLIRVSTTLEGDELVLTVKDNGIGIDPPSIPRLFSAFEQGSTNVTRQFGLGLAITKQLVLLHHGSIDAMSDGIGKGATFTMRFPLARSEHALVKMSSSSSSSDSEHPLQKQKKQKPGELAPPPPPLRQLRILVVEDNVATQAVMARMLQRLGHTCRICSSVSEAKAALAEDEYDGMLCDLGLADGSGLEVMAAAKLLQPRLYSAALTGYGTDDDVGRTRQAGFMQHMVKPIRLVQLEEFLAATSAHCT